MNSTDFNRLNGLLAKLQAANNKAALQDKSFEKHHKMNLMVVQNLQNNLKSLEQGLRIAHIVVD